MANTTHINQAGSSLIEVMVALLVTAIGLLGVMTMHAKALQFNQNAHLYSQATILANDIMEAMKTTPDAIDNYDIALNAAAPTSPNCSAGCTAAQLVEWNLSRWKNNVTNLLPEGKGSIDINDATNEVVITVQFSVGYRKDADGDMVAMTPVNVQLRTAG